MRIKRRLCIAFGCNNRSDQPYKISILEKLDFYFYFLLNLNENRNLILYTFYDLIFSISMGQSM